MMKMKLSDIVISGAFENTTPSKEKMRECREFWRWERKQDRPIVVNCNNVLVDGYCMYLVLMEHKEEYAYIIQHKKKHNKTCETLPKEKPTYKNIFTTYIFGIHPNSNCTKEFCWRVPASWGKWAEDVKVGDTVLCCTKFGFSPVIINRVEILDKPPVDMKIKRVAKREIRRNGLVVEL